MVTNQIYEYFQQMLDNFNGNDVLYETGVTYLFSLKPDNPYEPGTEEHRLFNKLLNLCLLWQKGGVDSKISFRRMIAFSKQFCEIVKENPFTYVPVVEEPVEEPVAEPIAEPVKEIAEPAEEVVEVVTANTIPAKVINTEPEVVLGVLPEEKKGFFKRGRKKKEGAKE